MIDKKEPKKPRKQRTEKPVLEKGARKLYKIGYLTKLLGVTARTIRYYDQVGLLPHVKRSDGRVRLFDDEDVEIIKKIRKMQADRYLPLDVIKGKLFEGEGEGANASTIVVITDSTAVIPEKFIKQFNIQIIPLHVKIKGKDFLDDGKISKKDFWKKNEKTGNQAVTDPPTTEEFVQKYRELHISGYQKIYSLHLSGKLSATIDNARHAATIVADHVEVTVIDSQSAGGGLGLFVLQVAEAIHRNESAKQIDLFIAKQIPLIYYITMVNDLKYLTTRGVVQAAKGSQLELMNKLFQFKPIFTLRGEEEAVDVIDCVKDTDQARVLLIEHIVQELKLRGGYSKYMMITYNYLYTEAVALSNELKSLCPNTPIFLEEGCVALTTYLGPETLSISIA